MLYFSHEALLLLGAGGSLTGFFGFVRAPKKTQTRTTRTSGENYNVCAAWEGFPSQPFRPKAFLAMTSLHWRGGGSKHICVKRPNMDTHVESVGVTA